MRFVAKVFFLISFREEKSYKQTNELKVIDSKNQLVDKAIKVEMLITM